MSAVNRRVIVMQSFVAIRATTNPYQALLVRSVADAVDVRLFSWRDALAGHFDVWHVHWPEVLIRDPRPWRAAVRKVLFLALLLRIRASRRALVRTLHNIAAHEEGGRSERLLLKLCDRWTTLWITLNATTPVPTHAPSVRIPHGHYRDWYLDRIGPPTRPGTLTYFGRIRRYKGVESLVQAFGELDGDNLQLRVLGHADTAELAIALERSAASDDRIELTLRHVSDEEIVDAIGAAQLVVLPHPDMHNSGTVLLALSLDRPVLVPDNAVTRELAREVGATWVLRYDGKLSAAALREALDAVVAEPPSGRPDLSTRDWAVIGPAHVEAFHAAISLAQAPKSR